MTNTNKYPVTVDGVRLDTYGYNISTKVGREFGPSTVGENIQTELRHGELWTPHKRFGASRMVIQMWVAGAEEDGDVPVEDYWQYRQNLDMLRRLFSVRHRKLDIRQTVRLSPLTIRQALGEMTALIEPSYAANAPFTTRMAVEFLLPDAFWFDISETTYDSAIGVTTGIKSLTTQLGAATAPMTDLWVVIDGPITNPQLFDQGNQHWVKLNDVVPNGSQWVVHTSTHSTKTGVGIEFTENGTNRYASTTFGGGHSPSLFGLVAEASGPSVRLEGTGLGANTRLRIRTKRAYL